MERTADIYTSLTRISDLPLIPYVTEKLPRNQWERGDYVVCEIRDAGGNALLLELPNGRMRGVIGGEWVMGALGDRFATLEATGSWEAIAEDGEMHVLTGAGLLGKLTSKSVFLPPMMQCVYQGHALRNGKKVTMDDFVATAEPRVFNTPVILFYGTSMSAGKTTSARIVTHLFRQAGYRVLGAKVTGAGRFKDILAMKDVGAVAIFDFVDVGLPSSICPEALYREKLEQLLSRMASVPADVAVVEIGASPLEPYNGTLAFEALKDTIVFSVLSASDPYAVLGVIEAFGLRPDLVTGVASNTLAGVALVERLCGVRALNLIDPDNTPKLRELLSRATGLDLGA
ncbi:hypothetical protein OZ410_06885 [Robiginitalea sp. M366]|uniref:hypothetical protein n=1 Tax=Robiginitalea aestuariiviva TaxID=3036903 RepID=UPI00240E8D8D|nr:hypothetical protein [Robiginitalea aestuariiviva]MDG1572035.1 hypothetical protein [Robiginitalea aestuariiviva]